MSATVDYFFSLVSPYAYLGHEEFLQVAREYGVSVRYRPVRMLEVFKAAGGVPLGQRPPSRQRYRLVELSRWREIRELPLNLHPAFFPVDAALVDQTAIALLRAEADPADYMLSTLRALWVEDRNLADRGTVAELLARHGHDPEAVLSLASSEAVVDEYQRNTEAAIAADLPGVPGYVLAGEPFWGQDRIEHLERALRTGRAPHRPT
ncbi:2-hydroxychromene-2-carboxylate isomerase [Pseudoxanthomonas sp. UTMC 1351]|uniref:2-hydroxychromene-2-carboxylate isomerase n=1 Tax=Pseudoxanthomonas sp. UTMC 1351 TaxID=2695853 RepID=UPI0034CD01F2